jgi:hypothetical protein
MMAMMILIMFMVMKMMPKCAKIKLMVMGLALQKSNPPPIRKLFRFGLIYCM